jgi:hypothetical protein
MTTTKFNPYNDYLRAQKPKEARLLARRRKNNAWNKMRYAEEPLHREIVLQKAKEHYQQKKNETTN